MIDLKTAYELRDILDNKVIDKIEDELGNIWYEAFRILPASGVPPITLQKCKGVDLVDYKIYGDSVQNGTPTPETPIEVESVGEYDEETGKYKIPVKVNDTVTNIYLKEPLRKIGNDADYIDFEKMQVIRKIAKYEIPKDRGWSQYPASQGKKYPTLFIGVYGLNPSRDASKTVIFTHDIINHAGVLDGAVNGLWAHNNQSNNYFFYWAIPYEVLGTNSSTTGTDNAAAIKTYCNNEIAEGRIPTIYYVRKTFGYETIELPNIPTFKGTTIIEVDTDVLPSNMEVKYYGKETN